MDWTLEALQALHVSPLFDLMVRSHAVHLKHHSPGEIQVCSLISIKTGGCPENCKYCPQSSHYSTTVAAQPLMDEIDVIEEAKKAIAYGASRICLGAAWREIRDNKQFETVLQIIKGVAALGVEVCCTLGMLKEHQAQRLKEAGLYAYNHNLDSSEKFYRTIISTRTYQDRLDTLNIIHKTGLSMCCGGILGMGEEVADRLELILTLSRLHPHPASVPINLLKPIPGTPLEKQPKIAFWEMLRIVAIARIVLPHTWIRLSCGRTEWSYAEQLLCFLAGANSIHAGEKLLTQENNPIHQDEEMFQLLGLKKKIRKEADANLA